MDSSAIRTEMAALAPDTTFDIGSELFTMLSAKSIKARPVGTSLLPLT
jgi:hypothetical protein